MSTRTVRGEKRKCQNEDCAARFYDLNRKEFDCPICGTTFDLELHAKQLEDVPAYIPKRQARVLPVPAHINSATDGASDTKIDKIDKDDATGDGDIVGENETAAAEAAHILLEEDEDTQDPLTDAVPLAVADDEEN